MRISKAEEVLGLDAMYAARQKGIDISELLDHINKLYPDAKKRGCSV
jgi:hypothetical protein